MPSRSGFATIAIAIALLLVALFTIFQISKPRLNYSTQHFPTLGPSFSPKGENNIRNQINLGQDTYKTASSAKQGYKRFESLEANFAFEYPDNFSISDYSPGQDMGREILICDQQLNLNASIPNICPSGMIIWYDGDGWGGGCDTENKVNIVINNKTTSYCTDNKTFFNHLYLSSPDNKHRFYIRGNYTDSFTPEVAKEIFQSIRISI